MTADINPSRLIRGIFARDARAISRLISMAENHEPACFPILSKIYPKTGKALRVGITGFPGSGKSTIINQLAKHLTAKRKKVGIILMDPSSPFSGGALLGDRIRMKDIQLDPRVFIRSMATRGKMSGLNLAARYACDILDAAGYDFVLLETVGVGQLEIDISTSSDVTVVVMTTDSGDEIQAMKAGLMEIADIFVVNKMDRDKDRTYFTRIKQGLEWHSEARGRPPAEVIPTAALLGQGVDRVSNSLIQFSGKKLAGKLDGDREKLRAEEDIRNCLAEMFVTRVLSRKDVIRKISKLAVRVRTRHESPIDAANKVMKAGLAQK